MAGTNSKVIATSALTREATLKPLLQLCMFGLLSSFVKLGVMSFDIFDEGKRDTPQFPKQNPLNQKIASIRLPHKKKFKKLAVEQ